MSQARCTFQVRGLDCPSEVESLRAALRDQPGVANLGFDLIHGTMTVDFGEGAVEPEQLARLITERTGLHTTVQGQPEGLAPSWWSGNERWVLTAGSGLGLALGLGFTWLGTAVGLSAAVAERLAAVGFYVGRSGGRHRPFSQGGAEPQAVAVRYRRAHGAGDPGCTWSGTMGRGRDRGLLVRVIGKLGGNEPGACALVDPALLDLAPRMAERINPAGAVEAVPASQVRRDDRVLVRAGDTIPVDGTVLAGRSNVDQKTITGESVAVLREPGDPVYAGTINGDGTLEVKASGPVRDALISRVVAQVLRQSSRSAPDRAADLAIRGHLHAGGHRTIRFGDAGSISVSPGAVLDQTPGTGPSGVNGSAGGW